MNQPTRNPVEQRKTDVIMDKLNDMNDRCSFSLNEITQIRDSLLGCPPSDPEKATNSPTMPSNGIVYDIVNALDVCRQKMNAVHDIILELHKL